MEDLALFEAMLPAMPRVPADALTDARWDALWAFATAWNGPICLEQGEDRAVIMSAAYYRERYGFPDEGGMGLR